MTDKYKKNKRLTKLTMSKLAQLIQEEIPENHVDLSFNSRRIRRDLDKILPTASDNLSVYFLFPHSQMNLIRYMSEEQRKRLNRITQLGFDYFENVLKLIYSNPSLSTQDISEKDEKKFPIQLGKKIYAYYLHPVKS